MSRVAALWLPNWSIDRIVRAEPTLAPPPERRAAAVDATDLRALIGAAQFEQVLQCDAPKNTGWRPGARWARDDAAQWATNSTAAPKGQTRTEVEAQIAALPEHQRPPMRMLGRSSEAVAHPFKAMPPDEAAPPMREMARRCEASEHPFRRLPDQPAPGLRERPAVPSVRFPGDGPHPDKHTRRGSNDPHSAPPGVAAFFDTGRTMAGLVGQVCREYSPRELRRTDPGPLIVTTHKVGSRIAVAAASPAAVALGIEPGMALTQVRASVPETIVRDADPAGDARDLAALSMMLARRWTPTVALSDADGLFLDLTGVAHLHGGEERMAARLVRMLARAGYAARIAIADTAGAAWALARHGGQRVMHCPPGAHPAALAGLPAEALRLEAKPLELLRRLGVVSVADITALPRAPFARRFWAASVRRLDQALGTVAEPLDPVVPPETIAVVQRFAEPIATADAIAHWLGMLVPRMTETLALAGQGARALLFVADRIDGVPQPIRIGFARPNRDPAHILRLIVRRIEEIDPGFGIDALHLVVRRVEPLGPQPFAETLEVRTPDPGPLVDTLANRAAPSWRSAPVDSYVPERSVMRIPALDPPVTDRTRTKPDDVAQLDRRPSDHPWHPRWPRPVRLLKRPERLDHVVAELPDLPPRRFTWRGQRHLIVRADGPERITGEWWRRSGERHAVRDYFRVENEAGQRFWLFRRGDGERSVTGDLTWYVHGRFG